MSILPLRADMLSADIDVRKVPIADIRDKGAVSGSLEDRGC
jgi:hypothetical protein